MLGKLGKTKLPATEVGKVKVMGTGSGRKRVMGSGRYAKTEDQTNKKPRLLKVRHKSVPSLRRNCQAGSIYKSPTSNQPFIIHKK